MVREKMAGYWNMLKDSSPCPRPMMEKAAPMMGPHRKPRENATPITAWECGERSGGGGGGQRDRINKYVWL